MNLSAVRVFVRDVAEAQAFYSERLGVKVTLRDLDHGEAMIPPGPSSSLLRCARLDVALQRVRGVSGRLCRGRAAYRCRAHRALLLRSESASSSGAQWCPLT